MIQWTSSCFEINKLFLNYRFVLYKNGVYQIYITLKDFSCIVRIYRHKSHMYYADTSRPGATIYRLKFLFHVGIGTYTQHRKLLDWSMRQSCILRLDTYGYKRANIWTSTVPIHAINFKLRPSKAQSI